VDLADLDARAGNCVKAYVQHRLRPVLVGNWRIHPGECVSLLLQRREHARTPGKNRGSFGRSARAQGQRDARRVRNIAVDGDLAQMVERAEREADRDPRIGALRQRGQCVGEVHVGDRNAADLDRNGGLVITEALQHRLQPIHVGARPRNQSQGAHRGRFSQRDEVGGGAQCVIHFAVADRGEVDAVGLRVGRMGKRRAQRETDEAWNSC